MKKKNQLINVGFLSFGGNEIKEAFKIRAKIALELGIRLLMIPVTEENLKNIQDGKKILMSYVDQNNVRKEIKEKVPPVCYDRTQIQTDEDFRRLTDRIIEVMEHADVVFINSRRLRKLSMDKWRTYLFVEGININTPDTNLFSKKSLENMLGKHKKVFIKSRFGYEGSGQIVIKKEQDHLLVTCIKIKLPASELSTLLFEIPEKKSRNMVSMSAPDRFRYIFNWENVDLPNSELVIKKSKGGQQILIEKAKIVISVKDKFEIKNLFKKLNGVLKIGEDYIIQEAIEIDRYQERVYDIRIVFQKDGFGKWQVTTSYVRLGVLNLDQSNISLGGQVVDPIIVFGEKYKSKEETLIKFGIKILREIEKKDIQVGEVGMDFLIDNKGNPIHIEMNTILGKEGVVFMSGPNSPATGERKKYWEKCHKDFFQLPIEYAKHLHPET